MKKRAELQSIADATRAAASSRRKAAEVAAMATLEANVASLLADREQDHALLTEQQGEISALRLAVGEPGLALPSFRHGLLGPRP